LWFFFNNIVIEVVKLGSTHTLRCKECGTTYPPEKLHMCEKCYAPLEVTYEYETIQLTTKSFQNRPNTIWRYIELLPVTNRSKIVDLHTGYTPLHKAKRLGEQLGLTNLYIKNDTVNPTYSFKDRPVAVAVTKALEFNAEAIGCASTGNLAASSAAHAAKAGIPCYVFIPNDTEQNKIVQIAAYGATIIMVNGTYDEANRLAMQVAEEHNWVFANFNVRPYYVEGSKTLAFEVCEQLDWNPPDHVIVPTGSGALLCAISKGFDEFAQLNLIEDVQVKIACAQPSGSSPVVSAFKKGEESVEPLEYPKTIAKSLAIGHPGDGDYALKQVRDSGGYAESATDKEIIEAIKLLARTEGVFTEPAGGVTMAVLKKLAEKGDITTDETVVCYITGNGLKATEVLVNQIPRPAEIRPSLNAVKTVLNPQEVIVWSR
jgi:threonine synthase